VKEQSDDVGRVVLIAAERDAFASVVGEAVGQGVAENLDEFFGSPGFGFELGDDVGAHLDSSHSAVTTCH
jgi:hypothetical protein